eukprot:SAG11_NODE_22778_length_400_cov_0.860465_1_plen_84_part_01
MFISNQPPNTGTATYGTVLTEYSETLKGRNVNLSKLSTDFYGRESNIHVENLEWNPKFAYISGAAENTRNGSIERATVSSNNLS